MRKNAARMRFGWLAAVAVLGVLGAGGWSGVEAQNCGFQPGFCPDISWETGVQFGTGFTASASPQCYFVTGITNFQPYFNSTAVSFVINGVGGFSGPVGTLPARADNGYYIYLPPTAGSWNTQGWVNGARPTCTPVYPPTELTINRAGSGTGTTVASPAAIGGVYEPGTAVAITATAGTGSNFAGWIGCASVSGANGNVCNVTMSLNREVTAVFNSAGGGGCAFTDAVGTASAYCGNVGFNNLTYRTENISAGSIGAGQCWFIGRSPNIAWNISSVGYSINGEVMTGTTSAANARAQSLIRNGTEMVDGGFYVYFPSAISWATISNITRGIPVCAGTVTTVTTAVTPVGGGTATITSGTAAGSAGRSVTITATAATNYVAGGFTGCTGTVNEVSATVNTCVMNVDDDVTVTAVFVPPIYHNLTLTRVSTGTGLAGSGVGTTTVNGVAHTVETPVQSVQGTKTIVATPTGSSTFSSWTGCEAGTIANNPTTGASTCVINLTEDMVIAANFNPPRRLTVNHNGGIAATGIVRWGNSTTAAGLTSGDTRNYRHNSDTTLTAVPATGDTVRWEGCRIVSFQASPAPRRSTCTVTMDEDKTVTATFGPPAATVTGDTLAWNLGTTNDFIAGSGNWDSETANWSSISTTRRVWEPGFSALFTGAASPPAGTFYEVTLDGPQSVNSIRFGVNGYRLTGGSINIVEGGGTINVGGLATINSAITGTAGVTKIGAGTLTLGGANTYTGATTITAGGLVVTNAFNNGGLLSGAGNLTKQGEGVVAFTLGTPAYTGLTTVSAGTLRYTAPASTTFGGNITVNGGVLELGTTATGATMTYGGTITGNVNVVGTLRTKEETIITGTVTVGAGTIDIDGGEISRLEMGTASTMKFGDGTTFTRATTVGILNINGTLDVDIDFGDYDRKSYIIAEFTNFGAVPEFLTLRVNGVVIGHNTDIDGNYFEVVVDRDANELRLEIKEMGQVVANHLSITSARLPANADQAEEMEVELTISGLTAIRGLPTGAAIPYADSAGIWYHPTTTPITAIGETGTTPADAVLLEKRAISELLSNCTTGNTCVITVTVPKHPNTPDAGVYGSDPEPYYSFHIKEYWVMPEVEGAGRLQGTTVRGQGDNVFMRVPSHVAGNSLVIRVGPDGAVLNAAETAYDIDLFVSGHSALHGLPLPAHKPFVDSVGLWIYSSGADISNPPAWVDAHAKIDLQTMNDNSDDGNYKFTVEVPANSVDIFYFVVAPKWYRAVFDNAGIFNSVAAAAASHNLHIDSVIINRGDLIANTLHLTRVQENLRNDVISITVSDTSSGGLNDPPAGAMVRIQFFWGTELTPFVSRPLIPLGAEGFQTAFDLRDFNEFAQEQRSVRWEIVILNDIGAHASNVNSGTFTVGRPRPGSLQGFTVTATGHDRVNLSWNKIDFAADGGLKNNGEDAYVLIRYSESAITLPENNRLESGSFQIRLNASTGAIVNAGGAGVTAVNDTSIIITGIGGDNLKAETRYWFAGAVLDEVPRPEGAASWSLISNAVLGDASTLPPGSVRNILKIDTVYVGNIASGNPEQRFTMIYSLTEPNLDGDKLMYGYFFSTDRSASRAFTIADTNSIKAVFEEGRPDTVRWDPGYNIRFETWWYVFLTVCELNDERTGGDWSANRIIDSVRVGEFTKQPVVVGRDGLDVGYANNNNIRVKAYEWEEIADPQFRADIERNNTLGGGDADFEYVSTGYRFIPRAVTDGGPSPAQANLSFSIKAENIPSGYTINDVRLYYWNEGCHNTTDGCWYVVHAPDYKIDESGWVTGNKLSATPPAVYRLMIDTQKPELFYKDTVRTGGFVRLPVLDSKGFDEEFFIKKTNVGNFNTTLYYSAANNEAPAKKAAMVASTNFTGRNAAFTIPADTIAGLPDNKFGLRAFLEISDGRNIVSINMSRSVRYNKYTNYVSTSNLDSWVPVAAQATLDKRPIREVMAPLFAGEEKEGYDNTKFRIFRWHRTEWLEYSDNNTVFNLEPGRLFWLKTREFENIEFNTDVTSPSLVDPFEITLAPGEWTDLMLPFSFDIRLGDIFDATDNSANRSRIDSLQIYKWEPLAKTYRASPIFINGTYSGNYEALRDSSVLEGGKTPFTIRNGSRAPVTLKVPPILASMSTKYIPNAERKSPDAANKVMAKQRNSGSEVWYYTVRSRIGSDAVSEIMAGYNPVAQEYGVPPSFGGESVVLIDDKGKVMGHAFSPDLANGGRTFKLRFTNSEKQRTTFSFNVQPSMFAPGNMQVMFVNAATGEPINGRSEYSISVGASSHEDVYMVVGSNDYLAKTGVGTNMKFIMGNIAVNQAARSARIRYYVPFAGVDRIEATAFDLKGSVVWKSSQKAQSASWNTMEWNSRNSRRGGTAAGLYIVQVKAFNAKGKPVAVANRRITFTP